MYVRTSLHSVSTLGVRSWGVQCTDMLYLCCSSEELLLAKLCVESKWIYRPYLWTTSEHRGWVVKSPGSTSARRSVTLTQGFHRFLNPSRHMLELYLKLGHGRFLHILFNYHPSIIFSFDAVQSMVWKASFHELQVKTFMNLCVLLIECKLCQVIKKHCVCVCVCICIFMCVCIMCAVQLYWDSFNNRPPSRLTIW
jgi:hypothetical protein